MKRNHRIIIIHSFALTCALLCFSMNCFAAEGLTDWHGLATLTDMATAKEGDSRAADVLKNWINAVFIEQGLLQSERLIKHNQIAIHHMSVLENGDNDRNLLK